MTKEKDEVIVLQKTLTPLHLWGLGVGIVISGNYFGWNFGLTQSGYLGMLIATLLMAIMYFTMCLGIAELSTILPHAGGPYAFARRAMGPYFGFITGIGVVLQYMIAAPTVSIAIGAYITFIFPNIPTILAAVIVYLIFIAVHMMGIKQYARLEMLFVIIAVGLLILMFIVGFFNIDTSHLGIYNGSLIPGGISGIWACVPFAMWLFVGIEMLPMLSEETRDIKKDMPKGLMAGMFTLLILAIFTITVSIGLSGVELLDGQADPLPAAVAAALGENFWLAKVLASVGIIGLISSFSGVMLAYSRQVFALSRAGYLPKFLSKVSEKKQTPYMAIIVPSIIGLILVTLVELGNLIIIVTFSALVSYIMMNLSVLILRKKEPTLERGFKTPLYPVTPIVSLILCLLAIVAGCFSNITFFLISIGIFVLASIYYFVWARNHINANAPEERDAKKAPTTKVPATILTNLQK